MRVGVFGSIVRSLVFLAALVAGLSLPVTPHGSSRAVAGELTAEHRKEIGEIRSSIGKVSSLIASKKQDEAAQLLDSLQARLHSVVQQAEIDEKDKSVSGLFTALDVKRKILAKLPGTGSRFGEKGLPASQGGPGTKNAAIVDFAKEIAPIFVSQCVRCHNAEDAKGGLRVDTYAGVMSGGSAGKMIIAGNSNRSEIIERLMASGPAMMPKGGRPLPEADVLKIVHWIDQGAKFAGEKDKLLADLAGAYTPGTKTSEPPRVTETPRKTDRKPNRKMADKAGKNSPAPTIAQATGSEAVSFSRDIAPFMVNLCVGCHSGGGRGVEKTGFSMESIEALMKGGNGGPVVVAGSLEQSRLWQLVGEQDPIKMPPGDGVLITKTNWRNLKTWILEGAKFDTNNPRASLRSLVPTEEEIAAKKYGSLSAAEFEKFRREQVDSLWKKAYPNIAPVQVDAGKDFLICGNVDEKRIKQVAQWAEEDQLSLRKFFHERNDGLLWRGRLAVFVLKERSEYEEFARTHDGVEDVPRDVHGHVKVNSAQEFAYVVLHDTSDDPSPATPPLRVTLTENMTQALLLRSKIRTPDWVGRGIGLVLASRKNPRAEYFRHITSLAPKLVSALNGPAEIFSPTAFSPDDVGPIGFTMVNFILKNGGDPSFVRFVKELQQGTSLENALQGVYRINKDALALGSASNLATVRGTRKRGK